MVVTFCRQWMGCGVIQLRITADIGGNKKILWIQHDNSDTSQYLICVSATGDAKLFHAKLPTSLLSTSTTEMFNPATFVAVGSQGNWVLGISDLFKLYPSLDKDVLNTIKADGKAVKVVFLIDTAKAIQLHE